MNSHKDDIVEYAIRTEHQGEVKYVAVTSAERSTSWDGKKISKENSLGYLGEVSPDGEHPAEYFGEHVETLEDQAGGLSTDVYILEDNAPIVSASEYSCSEILDGEVEENFITFIEDTESREKQENGNSYNISV